MQKKPKTSAGEVKWRHPALAPQAKSNQEIDLTFKLKSLQQSLEQEEAEHKATRAKLADKNSIDQTIEEAIAEAVKGESPASSRWGVGRNFSPREVFKWRRRSWTGESSNPLA